MGNEDSERLAFGQATICKGSVNKALHRQKVLLFTQDRFEPLAERHNTWPVLYWLSHELRLLQ